ncbi:MAG: M28 family peptidase [Ktedonobacteraceae bacterium]|nr:M28 family peptidase [Ktedonobacteraceae bacterium]
MRARWAILALQLFLVAALFLPAAVFARAVTPLTGRAAWQQSDQADFPVVDPHYIYDQLFTLATRYQSRQAGYDITLPNGHTGFADYWTQEMVRNLQGFGATVRRDPFPVAGWRGRPATSAAFNVEVSVPGAVHPGQVVIIGCHFDGEAISTQSAYDDASGCAIELGVAKALGEYWRQHNAYPARTLRFVIFDAEEQGLHGSFHYVNNTVNGDLAHIVAMFNEEQNGIAYPLRYLGQLKNPLGVR